MLVYVIFHCNEWQEYASMRLIGTASEEQLEEVLSKIQKKLKYSDEDMEKYIYVESTWPNDTQSMNIQEVKL